MSQLTISIPDNQDQRVINAFIAIRGYNPESGLTPGQFIKHDIVNYIKGVVRAHEQDLAAKAAITSVQDIDPS
jgi:hypothetical protein